MIWAVAAAALLAAMVIAAAVIVFGFLRPDRDPAGLVEGAAGAGALGHQPGRAARLAGGHPAARVVPAGGVPDVVRLTHLPSCR